MQRSKTGAYTTHNKVKVVRGGADYFNCIEEIADGAQYSLHLQTYIFDADETGTKVAEALIRAAKRSVNVYLLLDGYASQNLPKPFIARLKDAGVHFSFFQPLLKSDHFYFGRRLHHKVVVADSRVCMVAGINVSNRYNDMGETKAWLDWAIYAEGEIAPQLNDVCIKIWNGSALREKCKATKNTLTLKLPPDICHVRIRRNDWVYKKTEISKTYRELFVEANKHVTVMTSYFWPPQKLLKRMAVASRRGVKIRLILTAKADVPFSKYTERYLYNWLFRNNIEIYEYEKNVLHGKIAVCDNERITAGSYNVNNISAYASVELNLDIRNHAIAKIVHDDFKDIIANDCKQITEADFIKANNKLKLLLYYLSYRLTHFMFFLSTFYFIQRRGRGSV